MCSTEMLLGAELSTLLTALESGEGNVRVATVQFLEIFLLHLLSSWLAQDVLYQSDSCVLRGFGKAATGQIILQIPHSLPTSFGEIGEFSKGLDISYTFNSLSCFC